MKISVIITTYNRSDALELVLLHLACQTDQDFEIVVADDGSDDRTKNVIANFNLPLQHIWQQDDGFRAAKIRNKAVLAANGDYLIFIDGDCLAPPTFIARHRKLAEKSFFVAGNRVLLSEQFTRTIEQQKKLLATHSFGKFIHARAQKKINRLLPLLYLPLGPLRKVASNSYHGVKTCNLALWKQDFLDVNGFDESYVGWGYEDSDLIVRMLRNGVHRKLGRFAVSVLHLWHPENDRSHASENLARLHAIDYTWVADGAVKQK